MQEGGQPKPQLPPAPAAAQPDSAPSLQVGRRTSSYIPLILELHAEVAHEQLTREIMRYRSRLCQRGDLDKEVPITFAPTALIQSIRFLIAVAAHYGIHLEQNDIYTK